MITRKERKLAANAMIKAGHVDIKPEMIIKVKNRWKMDIYVAITSDALILYTPSSNNRKSGNVQFLCF